MSFARWFLLFDTFFMGLFLIITTILFAIKSMISMEYMVFIFSIVFFVLFAIILNDKESE